MDEIKPGSFFYYTNNPPVEIKGLMTLRDYFAAKAMQGLLMGNYADLTKEYLDSIPSGAYAMADAMLKARMEKNNTNWDAIEKELPAEAFGELSPVWKKRF